MTTDTRPKHASTTAWIDGRAVTIAGIAKGVGMIEPNMATMLAFLLTDAAASPAFLRAALREAADRSFNRLTVDGEGSTSDTALLLASGCAGNAQLRSARSPGARRFIDALSGVATSLARQLARDGEGATKLVLVTVVGARTGRRRRARRAADRQLAAGEDGAVRWRRELGSDPADDRRGPDRAAPRAHHGPARWRRRVPERRLRRPRRAPPARAQRSPAKN
jgi:N-acetylglutamate synthase/N-acetylornithine aminotransferase